MSELIDIIRENTDLFYYEKEQNAIKEEEFYQELFAKSLNGIQQNKQMFDELEIAYSLTNDKGKAVLVTDVFMFDEEVESKLVLTLIGEYKKETFDKYYSYYNIDAGLDSVITNKIYEGEVAFSIDYSNAILGILEKRPLGEFLNNFGELYSQVKPVK